MDKKKDKDQNWLEHNFPMAKIEFSDTCKSLQYISTKTLFKVLIQKARDSLYLHPDIVAFKLHSLAFRNLQHCCK